MKKRIISTVFVLAVLAGCGQTGPLYHPTKEPQRVDSQNQNTGGVTINGQEGTVAPTAMPIDSE